MLSVSEPPVRLRASVPLPLLMGTEVTATFPGPANVRVCVPPPEVIPPLKVSAFPPAFAACKMDNGWFTVTRLLKDALLSVLPPSVYVPVDARLATVMGCATA